MTVINSYDMKNDEKVKIIWLKKGNHITKITILYYQAYYDYYNLVIRFKRDK